MHPKHLKLATLTALMMGSTAALALPFSTFDPRSMAMGSTGVAVGDPSTAPFFNPALLSASDHAKKYSVDPLIIGGNIIAPVQTLTDLSDNGNLLTTSINTLSTNATTLTTDTTALSNNLTSISTNLTALSTNSTTLSTNMTTLSTNTTTLAGLTAANAATATTTLNTLASNLTTVSGNLTTVGGNLTTVGGNMSTASTNMATVSTDLNTVSGNSTSTSTNLDKVNQSLQALNNQPLQGQLGVATVVGVPSKNWGIAFYADAWAAMGGTLVYNDATTVSNISGAIGTASTALSSSATAIGSSSTVVGTASTSVTSAGTSVTSAGTSITAAATAVSTASTNCTAAAILAAGSTTTCQNSLTAANTALTAANTALTTANSAITGTTGAQANLTSAQTSLTSTSSTLTTNANTVTSAATTATANKTLQSKIHLRGVAAKEIGFSLSHGFVTYDQAWSLGISPKLMQLQLFDAELGANTGNSNNLTADDFLTQYSSFNFDIGVAKSYLNGWRTGVTVKNVIPQSFNFMSIASGAAAGSAKSITGTLDINPQVRAGVSHENAWSMVALDLDLTRNNPAGLESQSQYVALGGELSAWGWAQIRTGYRYDLLTPGQRSVSLGFGISPRIPYFKPHLDFAVTANPDIFGHGMSSASQVGASLKAGFNF